MSSAASTPPAHPPVVNPPIDPAVSALQAMFPDFDVMVLQSVLEACGNDQDAAIDMLLGMNDPDFVSSPPPPQAQHEVSPTSLLIMFRMADVCYMVIFSVR